MRAARDLVGRGTGARRGSYLQWSAWLGFRIMPSAQQQDLGDSQSREDRKEQLCQGGAERAGWDWGVGSRTERKRHEEGCRGRTDGAW